MCTFIEQWHHWLRVTPLVIGQLRVYKPFVLNHYALILPTNTQPNEYTGNPFKVASLPGLCIATIHEARQYSRVYK